MTSTQEAQWVLRAQVGDREAIEALLRVVQPGLARYVRAIVGPDDAEDVTQDVMVLIYRKLWTLSSPELFRRMTGSGSDSAGPQPAARGPSSASPPSARNTASASSRRATARRSVSVNCG